MGSDVGAPSSGTWHRVSTSTILNVSFTAVLILIAPVLTRLLFSTLRLLSVSRKLRSEARPPLPPGASGFSIVRDLISFTWNHDAFVLQRYTKYGPMFRSSVVGPAIFLEPPAGNKLIFANESKLVQAFTPNFIIKLAGKYALTVRTGAAHKQLRRHLMPFLNPPALSQYLPRIESHAKEHLAEFWRPSEVDDRRRVDFQQSSEVEGKHTEDFNPASEGSQQPSKLKGHSHHGEDFQLSIFESMRRVAFAVISDLVLSLRPNETDELRRLYWVMGKGLTLVPIDLPGTPFRRAVGARRAIYEIVDKMIVKRREELKNESASPSQDLLSYLLSTPDETGAPCGDEEIKDNVMQFLFAGHETTAVVMTMVLRSIALHPEVHQRLQRENDAIADRKGPGYALSKDDLAEMKYTWWVIQEPCECKPLFASAFARCFRTLSTVDTPFQKAGRYDESLCVPKIELLSSFTGYTIPEGWKMWWNSLSHVDPRNFIDPEKFDPTRFNGDQLINPYAYVPFGGGARTCPGNDFAKLEMLIILHYILRSYIFSLVNPSEPVIRCDLFPKQKSGTLMKIRKRS